MEIIALDVASPKIELIFELIQINLESNRLAAQTTDAGGDVFSSPLLRRALRLALLSFPNFFYLRVAMLNVNNT